MSVSLPFSERWRHPHLDQLIIFLPYFSIAHVKLYLCTVLVVIRVRRHRVMVAAYWIAYISGHSKWQRSAVIGAGRQLKNWTAEYRTRTSILNDDSLAAPDCVRLFGLIWPDYFKPDTSSLRRRLNPPAATVPLPEPPPAPPPPPPYFLSLPLVCLLSSGRERVFKFRSPSKGGGSSRNVRRYTDG
jgi:hypothetical protein